MSLLKVGCGAAAQSAAAEIATVAADKRNSIPKSPLVTELWGDFNLETGYFAFGGYFSIDFRTISSSLASICAALLLSSRAIARQTSDLVAGSRRSRTRVPSVNGTRTTRVPQPRHPAG